MSKSKYAYGKSDSCWEYRTQLEKILIGITILALVIVITLVVLLILQLQNHFTTHSHACASPPCLYEVSQIVQRVDPTINPCDDFYNFACGNLLKNAHGDEDLGSFFVIQYKAKRQIQEMYSEPLKDNDHRIVKVAKKLYRACMDEPAIERDGLGSIREVLGIMGGWPVVEGPDWVESEFSWILASYKLRELGFFYSSFMSVTLELDPDNEERFIFKVSLPDVEDFNMQTFDKQRWMVDTAIAFGAEEGRALIEIAEMHDFMLDMRRQIHLYQEDEPPQRLTVSEFQRRHRFINWRQFINNIIGPKVRISSQDNVLFPSVQSLHKWYNFLLKAPKRTQANYMLWRVIEESIPYLPELQSYKSTRKFLQNVVVDHETRPEFCIRQIRKGFSPSPIDIMYVQKYLPSEKRAQISQVIQNIKSELVNVLENADWMDSNQKTNAVQRVKELSVVVGAPEDYFEDGILDDLDFDMTDVYDNQTFLGLLAQTNRNYQSWFYNQIYSSRDEFKVTQWNLQTASVIGDYSREDNVVNLPATILQDMVFNEQRPKYLNYGSMGTIMGHHLLYMFDEPANMFDMDSNITNETPVKSLDTKRQCLASLIENLNVKNLYTTDLMLHQSLGLKVSYTAYEKWASNQNEVEPKLLAVAYTQQQLFWMSAAAYFCQPVNPYSTILRSPEEKELFSLLVSVPMLSNNNFASDFKCVAGSKMNPIGKCELF